MTANELLTEALADERLTPPADDCEQLERIAKAGFDTYYSRPNVRRLVGEWADIVPDERKRWKATALAILEAAELSALK